MSRKFYLLPFEIEADDAVDPVVALADRLAALLAPTVGDEESLALREARAAIRAAHGRLTAAEIPPIGDHDSDEHLVATLRDRVDNATSRLTSARLGRDNARRRARAVEEYVDEHERRTHRLAGRARPLVERIAAIVEHEVGKAGADAAGIAARDVVRRLDEILDGAEVPQGSLLDRVAALALAWRRTREPGSVLGRVLVLDEVREILRRHFGTDERPPADEVADRLRAILRAADRSLVAEKGIEAALRGYRMSEHAPDAARAVAALFEVARSCVAVQYDLGVEESRARVVELSGTWAILGGES